MHQLNAINKMSLNNCTLILECSTRNIINKTPLYKNYICNIIMHITYIFYVEMLKKLSLLLIYNLT